MTTTPGGGGGCPKCGVACLNRIQGAKLQNIIWCPFGNPPLKFGCPKLFQAFRMEEKLAHCIDSFWLSQTLIFSGCPVGNPCEKIGFRTVFLGVLDTRKLSNFAPWNLVWNGGSKIEKWCGIVWTQNGGKIYMSRCSATIYYAKSTRNVWNGGFPGNLIYRETVWSHQELCGMGGKSDKYPD